MSPSHEEAKREEISEAIDPFFKGGPLVKRPIFKIGVIWAVFTAIGVVIGVLLPPHIFPTGLSKEFSDVRGTVLLFTVLAAPVAAVVYAIAFYSLLAWRKKPTGDDEPPPDGPPLRGNTVVNGVWIGVSVILVLILLVWGMSVLQNQTAGQVDTIRVDVTGQQWLWTFSYPGTHVTSNVLELPINRPVIFQVTSEDVTHGFWPVQLGVQIDANPGFITYIQSTPDKLGRFDVRCSQLCGLYHAYMYTHGNVVTDSQFTTWLKQQGASPSAAESYALGAK